MTVRFLAFKYGTDWLRKFAAEEDGVEIGAIHFGEKSGRTDWWFHRSDSSIKIKLIGTTELSGLSDPRPLFKNRSTWNDIMERLLALRPDEADNLPLNEEGFHVYRIGPDHPWEQNPKVLRGEPVAETWRQYGMRPSYQRMPLRDTGFRTWIADQIDIDPNCPRVDRIMDRVAQILENKGEPVIGETLCEVTGGSVSIQDQGTIDQRHELY